MTLMIRRQTERIYMIIGNYSATWVSANSIGASRTLKVKVLHEVTFGIPWRSDLQAVDESLTSAECTERAWTAQHRVALLSGTHSRCESTEADRRCSDAV